MKKSLNFIFPLLIVVHLLLVTWWLAIFWCIVWTLFWFFTTPYATIVALRKKSYLIIPLAIIGPFLAAILFKTLFFGIYIIPTGSMKETIVPGDIIWVNSLNYGPRLPYSPYEIS